MLVTSYKELVLLENLLEINNGKFEEYELDDHYIQVINNRILSKYKRCKEILDLLNKKLELLSDVNENLKFLGYKVSEYTEQKNYTDNLKNKLLIVELILNNPNCYSDLLTKQVLETLKE